MRYECVRMLQPSYDYKHNKNWCVGAIAKVFNFNKKSYEVI